MRTESGVPTPRDFIASSIVLGVVSTVWFSIPPAEGVLRWLMVAGSVAGILLAVLAVSRLRRTPGPSTMSVSRRARTVYWAAVAFEVIAIPLAFVVLNNVGAAALTPAVLLGIVALHFIPLAVEFRLVDLWWITAGALSVAAVGIAAHVGGWGSPGLIAGGLGGGVLLLGGWVLFARSQTRATVGVTAEGSR